MLHSAQAEVLFPPWSAFEVISVSEGEGEGEVVVGLRAWDKDEAMRHEEFNGGECMVFKSRGTRPEDIRSGSGSVWEIAKVDDTHDSQLLPIAASERLANLVALGIDVNEAAAAVRDDDLRSRNAKTHLKTYSIFIHLWHFPSVCR